ncbi:hypothetical protein [Altibacter sp.]|uniref:hypothetical protein n=1 Tax=Altibacter sp. TaxID=2024823 RepID=UPI0025B85DED|nr:hypothetical protein [Altibacter sp.]
MYFPREMWAGSPFTNARQPKREVVHDKEEFLEFIGDYNGKMNVYTSVYNYDEFSSSRGLEHSVIIDRIFLDIDAHGNDSLEEAYENLKTLHTWLESRDLKHRMAFSGRGFYIFVYGKRTSDLRRVKAFFNICHDVIKKSPLLDHRVINTTRLRRVQNTYHLGAKRFSIPLRKSDLENDLGFILNLSKKPRGGKNEYYGKELLVWPQVKEIESVGIEIQGVERPATLPVIPCLASANLVQNPLHEARYLLVQWYNEIISDMVLIEQGVEGNPRDLQGEVLTDIKNIICAEIEQIANKEDVWIDYSPATTRKFVNYVVDKRFMSASCATLIDKGMCVGKCWRYGE